MRIVLNLLLAVVRKVANSAIRDIKNVLSFNLQGLQVYWQVWHNIRTASSEKFVKSNWIYPEKFIKAKFLLLLRSLMEVWTKNQSQVWRS